MVVMTLSARNLKTTPSGCSHVTDIESSAILQVSPTWNGKVCTRSLPRSFRRACRKRIWGGLDCRVGAITKFCLMAENGSIPLIRYHRAETSKARCYCHWRYSETLRTVSTICDSRLTKAFLTDKSWHCTRLGCFRQNFYEYSQKTKYLAHGCYRSPD